MFGSFLVLIPLVSLGVALSSKAAVYVKSIFELKEVRILGCNDVRRNTSI